MYEGMEFWDDVNDWQPLNWETAVHARKLEMEFFKKMGVHKKVPRDVAKMMGCEVITTKRADTNKGDTSRPNCRSRLVGREVKHDKRLDLFSATPPLETLKFLCSMCSVRDVITPNVHIPTRLPEDRSSSKFPKRIWNLETKDVWASCRYGTRDAAQNWAHEYTTFLLTFGFQVERATPCNFTHRARRVHLSVHGDDFTVVASA